MDRKWKSGASGTPPAAAANADSGYPTAGDAGTGTPPTKPGPYWFYMVTEEILAVITAAGIAFDKTVVTQLRDAIDALIAAAVGAISVGPSVVTKTDTGTQNDYALTLPAVRRLTVRMNNASLTTFTGFAVSGGNLAGDRVRLVNVNAQVDFAHNSGSSAGNKLLNCATSGATSISTGGWAEYEYDATTTAWRLIGHEQGAFITPAYNAADFTGSGGTWGVDSGDITTRAYQLSGRKLTVMFRFTTTDVGATSNRLQFTGFGGFSCAKSVESHCSIYDASATVQVGRCGVDAGASVIWIEKAPAANFTVTTGDDTAVRGEIVIEVS